MRNLLTAFAAIACCHAADDLDRLLAEAKPPQPWAGQAAAFTAAKESFAQATPTGETAKDFWVVRDRGRAVAVLDEGQCQLDWITNRPEDAPQDLKLPKVYSWVSLLGCRTSTVAWIDGQGPSGDTRSHAFSDGGPTITLTVAETWTAKRAGDARYAFTLRLDPVLGYAWDVRTRISVDRLATNKEGKVQPQVELLNIQPGQISDPWPDRWRYDLTLVSPPDSDGYLAFSNNLVAGDRSDNGGRLKQRAGGMTAFLADSKGWGLALVRSDAGGAAQHPNSTCNVWLDQHNYLRFPEQPDAAGRHVIDARWTWAGLPPAVVQAMRAKTTMMTGDKAVMVRLGRTEDFDDQPLPFDTVHRGLWTWGLQVDGAKARSGGKSLRVDGVAKPDGNTGRFIAPFVPLDSTATYRLEAWVWLEGGEDARFFMCSGEAKAEEGPMRQRSTNRVSAKGEWQQVSWEIRNRGNLDLRLVCLGNGAKAWVDDLALTKLP